MVLSTKDRQQIFTRLAPVLGEQEAETLLDQFPATTDTELVTVARILMITTIVAVLGIAARTNIFG